eukprot:scaffold375770_cov29-Prasinocladus_malaysianus.AAC.1
MCRITDQLVSTHGANPGETLQISLSIVWVNAVEKPQRRTQSVRRCCMQTKEFSHGMVRKCNRFCVVHFMNAGVQRFTIGHPCWIFPRSLIF